MKAFRKSLAVSLLLIPVLLLGSEFQMKIIQSEDDLPEKFCSIWKAGDFLLSDGENLAIIGGVKRYIKSSTNYPAADALGSIIGFAPMGKKLKSEMIVGAPVIRIKDKKEEVFYSSVKPVKQGASDGSLLVEAVASYSGKKGSKAKVQTLYRFFPGESKIDITSSLTNTGKNALEELDYSVYFNALHSYYFSPFNREMHPELRFRVYQKKGHYLAWLNRNPLEEEAEHTPGTVEPGQVYTTRHTLLVGTDHEELLRKIYRIFGVKPEPATLNFKDLNGKMMEVIVSDAFSSEVFFRSFLKNPFSLSLVLPEGTYRVRANFFPAVREKLLAVESGKENSCILEDSPLGRVKVKIQNSQGEYIPGKVSFIGLDPTETPYFEPDNPVETGGYWETFKNSVFPEERGLEVKLPVGTYLVSASRGPEYSQDREIIEVLEDEPLELTFRIDKVLKTPGLISIDPHMHTRESDGRMGVAERIRSVVAEGVEVAVACDHNTITNYSPTLKKLGLNKYLAVITGNEVTTPDKLHYNTYQVKYRPEEEENGAIFPLADKVSPLFEASRKKDQEAILQVNHPRAGSLGYFNNYQLDLESAAFAWENFDISFDVLEVMNGPYFYSSNFTAIKDWLHLLNRGYYYPLIGSSDSHGIDRGEPGYSRTYVYYKGEETDNLDWNSLAHSIRKGRTFATNGPIIEFKVNTTYISGDTFTDKDGKVDVAIKVQSAPWIAVDEVRLIVNGERRIIFPVHTPKEAILKFDMPSFGLPLLNIDSYIAVEVLGKESLYPVLQRSSSSGLSTNAILPYALTNPVFVDVDGNGKFDPPFPEKIKLVPGSELSKEIISRY